VKSETEEICPRCGNGVVLSGFAKNATRPDGHQSWCRPCLKGWRVIRLATLELNEQPAADAAWGLWVTWADGNLKVASSASKAAVKQAN